MFKISTVCGCGFGTSLLLKMAVGDILDQAGLKTEIQAWDAGSVKGQPTDLIICAEDLLSQLDPSSKIPIVAVRDMTDKSEIKEKVLPVVQKMMKDQKGGHIAGK
jgi:PTS system ascorbate-specific IIB component